MIVLALSATPADGAQSFDLQQSYDQALKDPWPGDAPPIGSGVHVAPGKVLTAAHVIARCRVLWARSTGTSTVPARILGIDARSDIAVLDAPGLRFLPVLAITSQTDDAALTVYGFPKRRQAVVHDRVATPARVAGLAVTDAGGRLLMLRGEGREGVSGGPVVDGAARVVGIIVAKQVQDEELLIAVAGSVLARFLDYLDIETALPSPPPPAEVAPSRDEIALPVPMPREKPRTRRAVGASPLGVANMPEWTSAVLQVGCTK